MLEKIVDLKSGIFSSKILWSTLNMNLDFFRNNLSKTVRIFNSSILW